MIFKRIFMNKQNFITVSLLVSALAFQPLVAQELNRTTSLVQLKRNSISTHIASILHERGLDEDAAKEITDKFVHDNELFTMMIENLLNGYKDVDQDDIFEYLSRAALHRQDVHLDNYGHLIHMISSIEQKVLDKGSLVQLNVIAKQNAFLYT